MGEIADWILDQFDEDFYQYEPKFTTCEICLRKELIWALTDDNDWRLHGVDGKLHHCHIPVSPLAKKLTINAINKTSPVSFWSKFELHNIFNPKWRRKRGNRRRNSPRRG